MAKQQKKNFLKRVFSENKLEEYHPLTQERSESPEIVWNINKPKEKSVIKRNFNEYQHQPSRRSIEERSSPAVRYRKLCSTPSPPRKCDNCKCLMEEEGKTKK